jgi:hypothetical protein
LPISTQWHDAEQTIIRCDITGAWTWEEFHASLDEAHQLLATVNHPVVIINVRDASAKTPRGNPFPHITRASRDKPDNQILTISVNTNKSMTQMVAKVLTSIFPFMPSALVMADTFEEALTIAENKLKEASNEVTE